MFFLWFSCTAGSTGTGTTLSIFGNPITRATGRFYSSAMLCIEQRSPLAAAVITASTSAPGCAASTITMMLTTADKVHTRYDRKTKTARRCPRHDRRTFTHRRGGRERQPLQRHAHTFGGLAGPTRSDRPVSQPKRSVHGNVRLAGDGSTMSPMIHLNGGHMERFTSVQDSSI